MNARCGAGCDKPLLQHEERQGPQERRLARERTVGDHVTAGEVETHVSGDAFLAHLDRLADDSVCEHSIY